LADTSLEDGRTHSTPKLKGDRSELDHFCGACHDPLDGIEGRTLNRGRQVLSICPIKSDQTE
jgi:hypothetical protein